jgi:S-DNA-T family DNA segregation ATPase FtsK/SpoIIIE
MIVSLGLLGIGATVVKYRMDNKEDIQKNKINKENEAKFRNNWNITMKYNGIKNKNDQTFEVLKYIPREKYGCDVIVSIPKGLSYDDLISRQAVIESSIGGIVEMEWKQFDNCIYLKCADKQINDKEKYTPVKLEPYQLLLGITPFHEYVIADMKISPHILYSGSNNSGKTMCLLTGMTNLVNIHNPNTVELYLAQISAKKDLRKLANLKHTKYYADTSDKAYLMYKHLINIVARRNDIFNKVTDGYVDNIFDYNKKFTKKKLPYIYVVCDEFSYYMPSSVDSEAISEWKTKCLDLILQLVKEGRSCGVYCIASLQRPDRENMNAFTKSQFNTKVVFHQNNLPSSLVVCDTEEAIHLKQREAIVLMENKVKMKTLYFDNKMLEEYTKIAIDINHKYLNLDGYDKGYVEVKNKPVQKETNRGDTNMSNSETKASNKAKNKIKTKEDKDDNSKR